MNAYAQRSAVASLILVFLGGCSGSNPPSNPPSSPTATLNPNSLSFGSVNVGAQSIQQVTLSNNGNSVLSISGVSIQGANANQFNMTTSCGSTLSAGSSCTIAVAFVPAILGSAAATLTVTDNAYGSQQTVALSGQGVAPSASLSPSSLAFAATAVGASSAAQTITLQNNGSATLLNIAINTAAPFIISANTCGTMLPVSNSCTVAVSFVPSSVGSVTGTLGFSDNASGSPQTVALSGQGIAPSASLSPASLTFAPTAILASSVPQTLTLKNTGSIPLLNITVNPATPPFIITSNACGPSLAVGASCAFNVALMPPCTEHDTFVPGAPIQYSGSLTVSDNASGSPQTVTLSGSGLSSATAGLTPGKILFGADGHRDKGGAYTTVDICQQILDLRNVFGSTPDTIFYRAWDSVHDYSIPVSVPADIQELQAAGILPLVGAIVDPPSLPGGSVILMPGVTTGATYQQAYTWAYNLVKSDAQAAPNNMYWFVGNEWESFVVGAGIYPSPPQLMDPGSWRIEPQYQPALGALAGGIQALRDTIPGVKIVSGVNDGTTSLGLTIALAQDLKAKGLMWDYTNLHWGISYYYPSPTPYASESPSAFYGFNNATTLYNAYTELNASALLSTGIPLFVDEFHGGNGNNSTTSTVPTPYDPGAGNEGVQLMNELVAHAPATSTEQGIVAATYYQLYPDLTGGTGRDGYLYTVTNGTSSLSSMGSMLAQRLTANPLVNSGAQFAITASTFSISAPGSQATSVITLVPNTAFPSGTTVTLTCHVWPEYQIDPLNNPSCNFSGQSSTTVNVSATQATMTVTTQAGTTVTQTSALAHNYVVTVTATTTGTSVDTSASFSVR